MLNDFLDKFCAERVFFGFVCCNEMNTGNKSVGGVSIKLGTGISYVGGIIHHAKMLPIEIVSGGGVT